ncbi:MAG: hypothetical protein FD163_659 [Hyphomonadaceae bacterium]|nr:MAG: hypothetical protein FD128_1297 [Hyphomonadaceae bacterium]KAF0185991.1 MAG: hypothetical protein FD163_659 [Hyphomonadaceae bacterium]
MKREREEPNLIHIIHSNYFHISCTEAFQFLLSEGLFKVIIVLRENDVSTICYRTSFVRDGLKIVVSYDSITHEIESNIEIDGERYAVAEIGRAAGGTDSLDWKNYCASSESSFRKGLDLNAIRTRNALNFLQDLGTDLIYKVKEQRRKFSEKMGEDSLVSVVRPAAYEAFRKKEYKQAIDLFEKMKKYLNKTDISKLKYAIGKSTPELKSKK